MKTRTSFLILLLASLLLDAAGCAAPTSTLMLQPLKKHVAYAQSFNEAFAGQDEDGSPAFLLVSDDASAIASSKQGATLKPAKLPPLRQVVYIKVLWRPMDGTHNNASNAAVDWYVMSNTVEGAANLLEYRGIGSVAFTPGDSSTFVTINSADLHLAASRGNLHDPIGPCKLTGAFTATNDNTRLQNLLVATRKRSAAASGGE